MKTHVKRIFRKLEMASRQDAAARARDLGLLQMREPSADPSVRRSPFT
jgi:hypothetical protein